MAKNSLAQEYRLVSRSQYSFNHVSDVIVCTCPATTPTGLESVFLFVTGNRITLPDSHSDIQLLYIIVI